MIDGCVSESVCDLPNGAGSSSGGYPGCDTVSRWMSLVFQRCILGSIPLRISPKSDHFRILLRHIFIISDAHTCFCFFFLSWVMRVAKPYYKHAIKICIHETNIDSRQETRGLI
eukprot:TRINITY_DN9703_c0_g1_i8.p1 TRINITY_DN9703_c0_g1~~TRINITY_DN9703_c0_g1_i8.p1  ORF type:complete len:114 (+),score=9.28 TRINITY_DN9703_c0_g1_i8:221-562(+)